MRTHFRAEQLSNPALAEAERNLRTCVHCGICTATCPTYVLLGDERDSPRGRIVMMQKMLEEGGAPSDETVTHIDRCLSCLGCRTACPSGVDYARLIDQSRAHIEQHYRRSVGDRLLRWTIANVLTRPSLTRIALQVGRLASPFRKLLPPRLRSMVEVARSARVGELHLQSAVGQRPVALLPGCIQQVIAPEIDEATQRLLARRDLSLAPLEGAGCCGALAHHLGRESEAKGWAKRVLESFEHAGGSQVFEGILMTATGCAAHLADYPHLFRDEPEWHARALSFVSKLVQLPELLSSQPCSTAQRDKKPKNLRIALQVPCSLQHGLRGSDGSDCLRVPGFDIVTIPESHLCCGSAGSYSIFQPEIANTLRARKLKNIRSVEPDIVATANVGCLKHLSGPDAPPVVHIAELLDWADGGPIPKALKDRADLTTRPVK